MYSSRAESASDLTVTFHSRAKPRNRFQMSLSPARSRVTDTCSRLTPFSLRCFKAISLTLTPEPRKSKRAAHIGRPSTPVWWGKSVFDRFGRLSRLPLQAGKLALLGAEDVAGPLQVLQVADRPIGLGPVEEPSLGLDVAFHLVLVELAGGGPGQPGPGPAALEPALQVPDLAETVLVLDPRHVAASEHDIPHGGSQRVQEGALHELGIGRLGAAPGHLDQVLRSQLGLLAKLLPVLALARLRPLASLVLGQRLSRRLVGAGTGLLEQGLGRLPDLLVRVVDVEDRRDTDRKFLSIGRDSVLEVIGVRLVGPEQATRSRVIADDREAVLAHHTLEDDITAIGDDLAGCVRRPLLGQLAELELDCVAGRHAPLQGLVGRLEGIGVVGDPSQLQAVADGETTQDPDLGLEGLGQAQ